MIHMHPKKTIIIRVLGGLGNQLFIYSFARYLSLNLNRQVYLETYTGFIKDPYKRKYRLNKFNIKLKKCPWYLALYFPLKNRFVKMTKLFFGNARFINEKEFVANPEVALRKIQKSTIAYLDGYWQDSNFFNNYEEIIKNELALKTKMNDKNIKMATIMNKCNSIAIHFRRVQYDTLLEHDYYFNSINQIKTKIENPHFFIFSDDIIWCKQNLRFDGTFTFVDHNPNDEIAELWLMSQCKHFIIANSTFSWWGAWLANNQNKIVIKPIVTSLNISSLD